MTATSSSASRSLRSRRRRRLPRRPCPPCHPPPHAHFVRAGGGAKQLMDVLHLEPPHAHFVRAGGGRTTLWLEPPYVAAASRSLRSRRRRQHGAGIFPQLGAAASRSLRSRRRRRLPRRWVCARRKYLKTKNFSSLQRVPSHIPRNNCRVAALHCPGRPVSTGARAQAQGVSRTAALAKSKSMLLQWRKRGGRWQSLTVARSHRTPEALLNASPNSNHNHSRALRVWTTDRIDP